MNKGGKIKVVPRDKGYVQEAPDKVEESTMKPMTKEEKDLVGMFEIYEEQYDPNQEFRIFGVGDQTKGGVQSM